MTNSVAADNLIKVVSFNLRRDFGPQRKNKWETRKKLAARMIQASGAAVVGVQEFLPNMRRDLTQMLGEYSIFGQGRLRGKNPGNDEHADILLRNDTMELLSCSTFWISKNPDHPSRAYFAAYPRICTVAEMKIKSTGARIRVFNTHFDHLCFLARNLGVDMILEEIQRRNEEEQLPTIVMGDFNAKPRSHAVRTIREELYQYQNVHLQDVSGSMDKLIGNTYHGFRGKTKEKLNPIDYIFVSNEFDIVQASVDTSCYDGSYPSDHYPITATLRLKEDYLCTIDLPCIQP